MKFGGVFLVLIVLVVGGYFYFVSTPQYAVAQFTEEYKQQGGESLKKYVDVDALADQIADEAMVIAKEEIAEKVGNSEYKELALSVSESLLPGIRETIRAEAKKAIQETLDKKLSNVNIPDFSQFSMKDTLPGGRISFEPSGADMLATFPNPDGKKVVFRLKKVDGGWKIVGIENLRDFTDSYR